jgi:adenylate cyclase
MGRMSGPNSNPLEGDLGDIYHLAGLELPSLTRAEVAGLGGVDSTQSVRWWRAMGFPEVADDEVAFGPEDVDIVKRLNAFIAVGAVSNDDVLRLARVTGASFSRLVEAQLEVVPNALQAMLAQGHAIEAPYPVDESDKGNEGKEDSVLQFLERTMNYVWRRHLLAALARQLMVRESDGLQAVCFADLSGFSRISKKASSEEIAEIIETFETTAFDVVSSHDARVVKFIGDEVMFVTESLEDGVDIAIDLIVRLRAIEIAPPIHCGLAYGPTVPVGGDIFGPTVNLASRLTAVARPDSIVLPRTDGKEFEDREDLDVRMIRRSVDLKGIGRTRAMSIRPLPEEILPDTDGET